MIYVSGILYPYNIHILIVNFILSVIVILLNSFLADVTWDSFNCTLARPDRGLQALISSLVLNCVIFWAEVQVKPCSTEGESLRGGLMNTRKKW